MVHVEYSSLMPLEAVGPADDNNIRGLLLIATRAPLNISVRDKALGILTGTCSGTKCAADDDFRSALMVALRYDPNSTVRAQALSGLAPYLAEDMHVRDAVLEAVLNDGDPQIRTQAIQMLAPITADSSVQQVFRTSPPTTGTLCCAMSPGPCCSRCRKCNKAFSASYRPSKGC